MTGLGLGLGLGMGAGTYADVYVCVYACMTDRDDSGVSRAAGGGRWAGGCGVGWVYVYV